MADFKMADVGSKWPIKSKSDRKLNYLGNFESPILIFLDPPSGRSIRSRI